MNKRLGKQTVKFENPPVIISGAAVVGKMEGEGPLAKDFDMIVSDDKMGQPTWDLAEGALQKASSELAIKKSQCGIKDIDYMIAGDLQNQCAASHYGLRSLQIPMFGIYGACSNMTESISIGSMIVDGGYANKVLCVTSSHFCTAEKQFRSPLTYGGQRPPSAQWTVTGSGALILSKDGLGPKITHITTGKIVDKGVTDANNMGAAMAPAAIDTISAHFDDTGLSPSDYDLILTGDLGMVGSDILCDLIRDRGYNIKKNHNDCGKMMFDTEKQDVHSGASGCGCCASVFCGHILRAFERKKYNNVLLIATGALMNTVALGQGESIPCIAHAVSVSV